jgi:hypothetical protein
MIPLMATVVMKKAVMITNKHNYSWHYSEPSVLLMKGIEALKKAVRSLHTKSQRVVPVSGWYFDLFFNC